jgi:hypothetical protein
MFLYVASIFVLPCGSFAISVQFEGYFPIHMNEFIDIIISPLIDFSVTFLCELLSDLIPLKCVFKTHIICEPTCIFGL